jgi:hypothetical protein
MARRQRKKSRKRKRLDISEYSVTTDLSGLLYLAV